MYALPYELYEKYAIRRYGFHGTSHRYVSARVCEFLGVDPAGKKIITAHIGNGGSCTAICDGKSIDTSMGLTPVEGLMMGTRSGDLDLGAATYIMDKENLNTAEFANLVNKKSGLMGVSGVSSDARDIDNAVKEGNQRADLARRMFIYRVKKYIGAYAAALNGVDMLVFTGGIGENDAYIRGEIIKGLSYLGIEVDEQKNAVRGEEAILSTPNSKVTVCVIPTDEEWMIASDTMHLV
jgi:acetate kinase